MWRARWRDGRHFGASECTVSTAVISSPCASASSRAKVSNRSKSSGGSASIGDQLPSGAWRGLYEPVHGSAPDIAGQNKPNPLAAIGSAAAMLNYSFSLKEEAAAIEAAIQTVLQDGPVTADLKPAGSPGTTEDVGNAVRAAIG